MAGKKKNQNAAQAAAPKQTTQTPPAQTLDTTPPASSPEQTPDPVPAATVVKSKKGLNLRVGPGREHAIREVLADGTELIDATPELPGGAEVPGWVFVRKNDGGAGWVDVRFVKAKEG